MTTKEELRKELEEAHQKVKKYEEAMLMIISRYEERHKSLDSLYDSFKQQKLMLYLSKKALVHRRNCEVCKPGDECDEFKALLKKYKAAKRREIKWNDPEFLTKRF